jgi:metal-responsive CopG/Arc/MetJ family transcriptional regulator
MKTAISIPDPLFQAAESLATRFGISRSQLYAKALQVFITKHDRANVTQQLNQVYAEQPSGMEPELMNMQMLSLPKEDW